MDELIDKDFERVKRELKKRYKLSDYEALIEFAAKYFISDSRRRIEMDSFHQAMFNLEVARVDDKNKELEKYTKDAYQKNILFREVVRLKSFESKVHSWDMNRYRHENNRKAKKLVVSWWKIDKEKGCIKADVANGYILELEKLGIKPTEEKERYENEVIYDWLTNL